MKRIIAILVVSALLTGCATMGGLSEPPRVSLVAIEPVDVRLFEQTFRVTLRVQNPNSQAITIRGLDYEIVVNDRVFAQGVSGKSVTVPAYGENTAEVEVMSTLQRVMEQLQAITSRGEPSIEYSISGRADIEGIPFPVPFEYEDSLSVPQVERREKKDGSKPRPSGIAI